MNPPAPLSSSLSLHVDDGTHTHTHKPRKGVPGKSVPRSADEHRTTLFVCAEDGCAQYIIQEEDIKFARFWARLLGLEFIELKED